MSIDEKKQQLNALMTEYSQLKGDLANKGRCIALKNQAANIMYASDFFAMLKRRVKNSIASFSSIHQPDEFITETFLKYVDEYDNTRNDNFYAFFLKYLGYTITNILRREHPERQVYITIEDDEGDEQSYIDTVPDNDVSPETLAIIHSLPMLFDESSTTEEDINSVLQFCEYLTKMVPCILHIKKHQKSNEKSYQYYSAFATDFFISFCKIGMHLRYDVNENDVFSAIDLKFADFTLVESCRSFYEFKISSRRKYSELGLFPQPNEKKPNKRQLYCVGELHIPFRNPIYRVYHNVKDDSSISQQRTKFREELGKISEVER